MKMVLIDGQIKTKQRMKGIGLAHKNMVKGLKFGQMDIFIKVNLKIASGAVKEF